MTFASVFTPAYNAVDLSAISPRTALVFGCSAALDTFTFTNAAKTTTTDSTPTWSTNSAKSLFAASVSNAPSDPYAVLLYRKALSSTANTWCEVSNDQAGGTVILWGSTVAPAPLLATATARRYTIGSDTYQLITFAPATTDTVAYLSPTDKFSITGFTMSNCVVEAPTAATTVAGTGVTAVTAATRLTVRIRCRDTSASFAPAAMAFSATANGAAGTVTRDGTATAHTLSFSPTSELIYRASPTWFPGAKPIDVTFFSTSLTLRCSSQIPAVTFVNAAGDYLSTITLSAWTGSAAQYVHSVTLVTNAAGLIPLYRSGSSSSTPSCSMDLASGKELYVSGEIAQAPMIGAATTVHYASPIITVTATAQGSAKFWSTSDTLSVTGFGVLSCLSGANTVASFVGGAATLRPLGDQVLATALTMTCIVSGAYTRSAVAVSWSVSNTAYPVTPTAPVTTPALTLESTMTLVTTSQPTLLAQAQFIDVSSAVEPLFGTNKALVVKTSHGMEISMPFTSTTLLSSTFLSAVSGALPYTQTVPLPPTATMLVLLYRTGDSATIAQGTIETASGVKVYVLETGSTMTPTPLFAGATAHRYTNASNAYQLITFRPAIGNNLAYFSPLDSFSITGVTLADCAALIPAQATATSEGVTSASASTRNAVQVQCRDTSASFAHSTMTFRATANGVTGTVTRDGSATAHTLSFLPTSEIIYRASPASFPGAKPIDVTPFSGSLMLRCSSKIATVAFIDAAGEFISTTSLSSWTSTDDMYSHTVTLTADAAGFVLLYRDATSSDTISCAMDLASGSPLYVTGTIPQAPMIGAAVTVHYASSEITVTATA